MRSFTYADGYVGHCSSEGRPPGRTPSSRREALRPLHSAQSIPDRQRRGRPSCLHLEALAFVKDTKGAAGGPRYHPREYCGSRWSIQSSMWTNICRIELEHGWCQGSPDRGRAGDRCTKKGLFKA